MPTTEYLPRQARDKRRKSCLKRGRPLALSLAGEVKMRVAVRGKLVNRQQTRGSGGGGGGGGGQIVDVAIFNARGETTSEPALLGMLFALFLAITLAHPNKTKTQNKTQNAKRKTPPQSRTTPRTSGRRRRPWLRMVRSRISYHSRHLYCKNEHFTKTGSGHTSEGTVGQTRRVCLSYRRRRPRVCRGANNATF